VTYFLVESTSFFSCKTSGTWGGAIYFQNTNSGHSVLYGVCGYDCNSNLHAQFAYTWVSSGSSYKNNINYLSIIHQLHIV
jgi:hypothetical protein